MGVLGQNGHLDFILLNYDIKTYLGHIGLIRNENLRELTSGWILRKMDNFGKTGVKPMSLDVWVCVCLNLKSLGGRRVARLV